MRRTGAGVKSRRDPLLLVDEIGELRRALGDCGFCSFGGMRARPLTRP